MKYCPSLEYCTITLSFSLLANSIILGGQPQKSKGLQVKTPLSTTQVPLEAQMVGPVVGRHNGKKEKNGGRRYCICMHATASATYRYLGPLPFLKGLRGFFPVKIPTNPILSASSFSTITVVEGRCLTIGLLVDWKLVF